MEKIEVIGFRKQIAAGTSETLKARIKGEGTIEGLRVRFYPGQQLDLQVIPKVKRLNGSEDNMVTYVQGGRNYLAGDDDYFILPVNMPVYNDEEVVVYVTNADGANAYDLVLDVIIDYYAGSKRVIGGVI